MFYEPPAWESSFGQFETQIFVLKLKDGMESPITNPYYYDEIIKNTFYDSYKVSCFPEIEIARLLETNESYVFNIKNQRENEPENWALKAISDDHCLFWQYDEFYPKDPMRTKQKQKIGIRPALVMKNATVGKLKLKQGDLLIVQKYTKESQSDCFPDSKSLNIFSVISQNLLLSDEYIGLYSFDYKNNELGNEDYKELNERIDPQPRCDRDPP